MCGQQAVWGGRISLGPSAVIEQGLQRAFGRSPRVTGLTSGALVARSACKQDRALVSRVMARGKQKLLEPEDYDRLSQIPPDQWHEMLSKRCAYAWLLYAMVWDTR